MSTLRDFIGDEIAGFLTPVRSIIADPPNLEVLLGSVGATLPDAERTSLLQVLTALGTLGDQVDALLAESAASLDDISRLLEISRQIVALVRGLESLAGSRPSLSGIGEDLLLRLLTNHLRLRHPRLRQVAVLLGLIQSDGDLPARPRVIENGVVVRESFSLDNLRFGRLVDLLRDPPGFMRAEYGNPLATSADAAAMADKLFPRFHQLLTELGVPCSYGFESHRRSALGDAAPLIEHALIIYTDHVLAGAVAEAGIVITISATDQGDLGFVFAPFGALTFTRQLGVLALAVALTANVEAFAVGRNGLTVAAGSSVNEIAGTLSLEVPVSADGPAFMLGSEPGTRLEIGGAKLAVATSLADARRSLGISVDVTKSALVIAAADGDGFLAQILPANGLRVEFDLGIGWSSDKGVTLRGSAGLEATYPVTLSVAGVSLTSVHVGLRASGERVNAEISASIVASIGPVQAVLDRVGIASALSFPQSGGNLGVADLDIGFKSPSLIGVTVDAHGVVSGGGFLTHDAAQGMYGGAMQLTVHEQITLKAFGIINTRMPDGSRGYSLIVFITAEDFRPIQLGLGFTLLGIGGMVAINHTFDQQALQQGLKNDTLGALLFPRDPVGNASTLLHALTQAFPVRRGSYLVGLLVKLGWFTPTLVLLDLALILEFGNRTRLLALGRISVALPSADNDLVRLNMDALGVLDFDEGSASIDAVLVDSRFLHRFPITGAAALRAGAGAAGSAFLLAAGGFNPHFTPPRDLPTLDRLALALSSGNNPRLLCEAYFAISANTLQFGARAQLYAAAGGASVEGDLGFDVLLQWVPLHFIADFHAMVHLKVGSHSLLMVALEGQLEGPRPLRVSGRAQFKVLFFHFSVRFDLTLVHGEPPPLPLAVDVRGELVKALLDPQSWSTQRLVNAAHGVALRALTAGTTLVLDPLGQLTVKQQVVPLNTARDIDTFGGAPLAGDRRFSLSAAFSNTPNAPLPPTTLRSGFAPAQFFNLSEDEKLSAPSFEQHDAGCTFGTAVSVIDETQIIGATLDYQTVKVDLASGASTLTSDYLLTQSRLKSFARSGAAGRAAVRGAGRARFRNAAAPPAVTLNAKSWRIVPRTEGAAASVAPNVRTWSEYQAVLKTLNRGRANWQLLPAHELQP